MITFDVGDLRRLSAELGASELRLAKRAPLALAAAGKRLQEAWKANATQTAGVHGKWYPNSIKAKPDGPFAVKVGPTSGKQHTMSFEYGSRNQPPHLDGQRALDAQTPNIVREIETVVAGLL